MESFGVLFGSICKETYNLISSRKKMFTQNTMALILIDLARTYCSYSIFSIAEKADVFAAMIIFSLWTLSTSAAIYTIAFSHAVCTGGEESVTFKKAVMSLGVWRRFCTTSLFVLLAPFACFVDQKMFEFCTSVAGGWGLILAFTLMFLFVNLACELAVVVSVVEESRGFEALRRGKQLLSYEDVTWTALFITWGLRYAIDAALALKVSYWVISLILRQVLGLVSLVFLTVVYCVFRSGYERHED